MFDRIIRFVRLHPLKRGRVTVPGRLGDDLHLGTLKSILVQAGLKGKA